MTVEPTDAQIRALECPQCHGACELTEALSHRRDPWTGEWLDTREVRCGTCEGWGEVVPCPNCIDGTVTVWEGGENMDGEPVGDPVAVPEQCDTCGGNGVVPAPAREVLEANSKGGD